MTKNLNERIYLKDGFTHKIEESLDSHFIPYDVCGNIVKVSKLELNLTLSLLLKNKVQFDLL